MKPLILISNDDGVLAKGLQYLINIAKLYGDVFVVAPEKGESGMSHAITIKNPIRVKKLEQTQGLTIYSCNGTPVDTIKLALDKLIPRKPDLILSGINHGSNSAISLIYSGTMGAAREGALNSIPSIGFSITDHSSEADFEPSVKFVKQIIEDVLKNGLEKNVFLNVNIPNISEKDIKGIKICAQTNGLWKQEYDERTDPNGGVYYWLTGYFDNYEPSNKETDEWALQNNYIAIVPVKLNTTEFNYIETLKNRYNEIWWRKRRNRIRK